MDHWDADRNEKFTRRILALSDPENQEDGDAPICPVSLQGVRDFIAVMKPQEVPSLGASYDGIVLATWREGNSHITFQFLPEITEYHGVKLQKVDATFLVTKKRADA